LNAQPDDLVREEDVTERALHEGSSRVGWLSRYARTKKLPFFFERIPRDASILDVGCASGWVKAWAGPRGWDGVVGIDVSPPADIVGDVRDWKELGLEPHSFDVIVAFEVVEHCDMAAALLDLLKPDGLLMVTTPVPRFDWACKALETVRILQPRVGPHSNLVDLRDYAGFSVVDRRIQAVIAQWGILRPS
jgi:2-polyprenyl-3-methyl-5-hydroxy-6-metoxy-1,4-benzoquinol methylase